MAKVIRTELIPKLRDGERILLNGTITDRYPEPDDKDYECLVHGAGRG